MSPYLVWVTVAVFASYLVIQDANVVEWFALQSKALNVALRRLWFGVRHHPDSPWVRLGVRLNADRIARKLRKELEETRGPSGDN